MNAWVMSGWWVVVCCVDKNLSGMVGTSSSMVSSHFSRVFEYKIVEPTKFHQIVNQHVIWNSAFDFKKIGNYDFTR